MSDAMTPSEFLAIYNSLDESRKQELVEHALELIEEQRGERRTEQRVCPLHIAAATVGRRPDEEHRRVREFAIPPSLGTDCT